MRANDPASVLDGMFGPDFDLYDGYAALLAELRCDAFASLWPNDPKRARSANRWFAARSTS